MSVSKELPAAFGGGKRVLTTNNRSLALGLFVILLCFGESGLGLLAQSTAPALPQTSSGPVQLPLGMKTKAAALGQRFAPGNERLLFSGSVTRGGELTSISMAYQTPGKIRYQEEGGRTIVFDGTQSKGSQALSPADQDLIESLLDDCMEGLVYSVPHAMLFRPLMYRARLDDGKAKVYPGPYVDIYEAILHVASQGGNVKRQKHLYFDSNTELLDRVVYMKGTVTVETRLTKWEMVNKVMVPGNIMRFENGVNTLSLTVDQVAVMGAANNSAFQLP